MKFITFYKQNKPKQKQQQITYFDFLNPQKTNQIIQTPNYNEYFRVTALLPENTIPIPKSRGHIIYSALEEAYEKLTPFNPEKDKTLYYTFKIPKRSGGLRTITAPTNEFKDALADVKDIIEKKLKCLPHDAAFAYSKQRSVKDALLRHKQNKSRWFLKLDLTDFFPSCTPDLIYENLVNLYPFILCTHKNLLNLKTIINKCCLNNGLPQGTPISPLLSNLVMVKYDYLITQYLHKTGQNFVYTRYADDILISSQKTFDYKKIEQDLQKILNPFIINTNKTRYGSRAGSNWNLGLMLNKDNNITIGFKRKKQINAILNNFMRDNRNNWENWTKEDVQIMQGQVSYLRSIEPEYTEHIIKKYENKYNCEYAEMLKLALN